MSSLVADWTRFVYGPTDRPTDMCNAIHPHFFERGHKNLNQFKFKDIIPHLINIWPNKCPTIIQPKVTISLDYKNVNYKIISLKKVKPMADGLSI